MFEICISKTIIIFLYQMKSTRLIISDLHFDYLMEGLSVSIHEKMENTMNTIRQNLSDEVDKIKRNINCSDDKVKKMDSLKNIIDGLSHAATDSMKSYIKTKKADQKGTMIIMH